MLNNSIGARIDRTLEVPDARLSYEVRGQGPLIVLCDAPMDAAAFAPLAELLAADHTVLTTDPRGINRSQLDDPSQDSTPQLRADDLSRLITHLDAGPAIVLGSSGGAVSALALAETQPQQVHTVIAHEPPLDEPDWFPSPAIPAVAPATGTAPSATAAACAESSTSPRRPASSATAPTGSTTSRSAARAASTSKPSSPSPDAAPA